jgi:excisionase family DNA binding protein
MPNHEYLTLQEVADLLRCSRAQVRRLMDAGNLKGINIGVNLWRFNATGVAEWMRRRSGLVLLSDAPTTSGVYAIACGQYVKIGKARNIKRRMATLQACNPEPLKLLAVLSEDPADETMFHQRFAAYRHSGEWFRVEGELAAFLSITPAGDA